MRYWVEKQISNHAQIHDSFESIIYIAKIQIRSCLQITSFQWITFFYQRRYERTAWSQYQVNQHLKKSCTKNPTNNLCRVKHSLLQIIGIISMCQMKKLVLLTYNVSPVKHLFWQIIRKKNANEENLCLVSHSYLQIIWKDILWQMKKLVLKPWLHQDKAGKSQNHSHSEKNGLLKTKARTLMLHLKIMMIQ